MKFAAAVLGLGLLLGSPFKAIATPAPQPLSITFHGDGARATQLTAYDPGAPIAISVKESGGLRVDSVTVIASGPAGEALNTPLVRGSDGSFSGTFALEDLGAWNLRVAADIGKIRTETSPVTLDVAAPAPSNAWQVGLAVGIAIFVLIGGTGFVFLRRAIGKEPVPDRTAAA